MLFIVHECEIAGGSGRDACDAGDFPLAGADQAGSHGVRDLLERALHASHSIAGRREEGRSRKDQSFSAGSAAAGVTLQVAAPWHMMNVPEGGLAPPPVQAESELFNVHVPMTTPLLRLPIVVVVPLEVPVTVPVSARVLLFELALIVSANGPVTVSVAVVVRVVVPEIV